MIFFKFGCCFWIFIGHRTIALKGIDLVLFMEFLIKWFILENIEIFENYQLINKLQSEFRCRQDLETSNGESD